VPAGNIENWEGFDPFGAAIDKDGNHAITTELLGINHRLY
jgi:hypothetical protein